MELAECERRRNMKKYTKPVVTVNDNLSEGVYMASGCYTASAKITQTPEPGRDTYCVHVEGEHHADHTREAQTLTLTFNQPVTYSSSKGTLAGADTGTMLVINYGYHQNPTDNIGLGDVYVTSDAGLAVTGVSITD